MRDLILREAQLSELPRIAELKRQIHEVHVKGRPDLFAPYKDIGAFAGQAAAKNCGLLLAEQGTEPVGFVLYQIIDRPASPYMNARRFLHVEEFCVDEKHQRMGVGRLLMDKLKNIARRNGCPRIELDVWSFNEGAKQFYEATGMTAYRTFMEMNVDKE